MNNEDLREHLVHPKKKMSLKEMIGVALVTTTVVGVVMGAAWTGVEIQELRSQVPDCMEDEVYSAVHYKTPGAVEDIHGVTRMCIHYEDIVDRGIEVAIQNGVLEYVYNK